MDKRRQGLAGVVAAVFVVAVIFGVRMCSHAVGESGGNASEVPYVVADSAFVADSAACDTVVRRVKSTKKEHAPKRTMRLRSPLDEPVASE